MYLGVTRNTIYNMINRGEINSVDARDSYNRIGILKSELDSFISRRPARQPTRRPRGADRQP
jgi:predicted DNA-binding transcriptional regulator AlpA